MSNLPTRFYFVRHGQSEWNVVRRIAGTTSHVKLTDLGRQQALKAAETLQENDILPSAIICSPLDRAKETSEIIGHEIGIKPIPNGALVEYCAGEWQGELYVEKCNELGLDPSQRHLPHAVKNGEPLDFIEQRAWDAVKYCSQKFGDDVLFVAHNGVCRALTRLLLGASQSMPNAGVLIFEQTNNKWIMRQLG